MSKILCDNHKLYVPSKKIQKEWKVARNTKEEFKAPWYESEIIKHFLNESIDYAEKWYGEFAIYIQALGQHLNKVNTQEILGIKCWLKMIYA